MDLDQTQQDLYDTIRNWKIFSTSVGLGLSREYYYAWLFTGNKRDASKVNEALRTMLDKGIIRAWTVPVNSGTEDGKYNTNEGTKSATILALSEDEEQAIIEKYTKKHKK